MDVGSVDTSSLQNTITQGSSVMGKDDFLKLLITQLKYQDPASPLDGSQFASQLAQFSSLEQLSNLNDSVKQSINANFFLTQSINNTMTANLIGKNVKINSNKISDTGQDSISLGYNLPSSASTVSIKVYDQNGQLVRTINDLDTQSGDHQVSWDFTDNDGNRLPDGNYTFEVEAKDYNENDISADTYITGQISGVRFDDDGTKILVGDTEYMLSDILEILNPSGSGDNNG